MGAPLVEMHDSLQKRRGVGLFDDFLTYTDAQLWTLGGTGTGTGVANTDHVNGWLTLTSGATLNNEAWVAQTRKNVLLALGQPAYFECRINYQEANVGNLAGIFAGFSSGFATDLLVDGTLLPKLTSMSSIGFTKGAGQTVWSVVAQVGTTQFIQQTQQSCISTLDQILGVDAKVVGGIAECTFRINGVNATYPTAGGVGAAPRQIKFQLPLAGVVAMCPGVMNKAGGAFSEVCNVDYIAYEQLRGLPAGG